MDLIFLFPGVPYQLDQLANSQPKLSAFFPMKSCAISEDVSTVAVSDINMDPSLNGSLPRNENYSEVGAHIEDDKQMDKKFGGPEHDIDELCNSTGKCLESRTSEASVSETDYGNSANNGLQSNLHDVCASHRSYMLDNQNLKRLPNSAFVGPSNRRHSTIEDPNFVANYFKVPVKTLIWF
uniref:DNA repair protein REV1 n=1 Tax=Rhizophora mucronata TaxID=61149 RepID=A0A2P2KDG2_RHIMU